jgi:hypothetical protein
VANLGITISSTSTAKILKQIDAYSLRVNQGLSDSLLAQANADLVGVFDPNHRAKDGAQHLQGSLHKRRYSKGWQLFSTVPYDGYNEYYREVNSFIHPAPLGDHEHWGLRDGGAVIKHRIDSYVYRGN